MRDASQIRYLHGTNRRTSRHLQIKLRDVRMDHYEALLA